jgi:hypothetical protein
LNAAVWFLLGLLIAAPFSGDCVAHQSRAFTYLPELISGATSLRQGVGPSAPAAPGTTAAAPYVLDAGPARLPDADPHATAIPAASGPLLPAAAARLSRVRVTAYIYLKEIEK